MEQLLRSFFITYYFCLKEYAGSTVARFMLQFSHYNPKINLNLEGRRGFKQEKNWLNVFFCVVIIEHIEDIKVQRIGHCDPNDHKARENFWIFLLDTLRPQGLNQKRALKYLINWFSILMSIFDLTLVSHIYKNIIAWITTSTSI